VLKALATSSFDRSVDLEFLKRRSFDSSNSSCDSWCQCKKTLILRHWWWDKTS